MKKTLIVSMFGGPCSGKSTQAAGLFYRLKMRGINCELVTEKAKSFTWEENETALNNQIYVSGHQIYKQEIVEGQVDVIITDSPIIIGLLYNKRSKNYPDDSLKDLLIGKFKEKNNLNILLKRKQKYNPVGRSQTENQAKNIDKRTKKLLIDNDIDFEIYDSNNEGLIKIESAVLEKIADSSYPSRKKIIEYCVKWLSQTPYRKNFKHLYISFRPTVDDLLYPYQHYDMKLCIDVTAIRYNEKLHDNIIDMEMTLHNEFDSIQHVTICMTSPMKLDKIKKHYLYNDVVILK